MNRLALFALLLATPALAQDTESWKPSPSMADRWWVCGMARLGQSGFRGLFGNLTGMTPMKLGQSCPGLLPHRPSARRTGNVLPPVWIHGPRDYRGWPCPDWWQPHGLRGRTARRQYNARTFSQPFLAGPEAR